MNTKFAERVFRALIIFMFVLGMNGVPKTRSIAQQNPNHIFSASPQADWVTAGGWPLGTEVALTIDGAAGFYTTTKVMGPASWDPDQIVAEFDLNGYDIQAGDVLTVTAQGISKILTISSMQVNDVNLQNDTASGSAAPGMAIDVCAHASNPDIHRFVQADSLGNWLADFGVEGIPPGDPGTFDIQPGSVVSASVYDDDGDRTLIDWYVPTPRLQVRANSDSAEVINWPMGAELTLTIDDPETTNDYTSPEPVTVTQTTPWGSGETYVFFDLNGIFDIQAGFEVSVSDGTTTRAHTVTNLSFTNVDLETDIVSGIASPDADVQVWACDGSGCSDQQNTTADVTTGEWQVDFTGIHDIVPGTWIDSVENDSNGNGTMYGIAIPTPYFQVRVNGDNIQTMNWPMGAELTLTIDDPATTNDYTSPEPVTVTQTTPWGSGETYAFFDINEVFDIQPGFVVSMSDGTTTKTHTVTNLSFTNVDLETDIVSGIASPGAYVELWVCDGSDCNYRQNATADATTGEWEADFTGIHDIVSGTWIESIENDSNGNGTLYGVTIPNPRIDARANNDWVEGFDWEVGAILTLEINDPGTPEGPDYTATGVVGIATNPADYSYIEFHFGGTYDLKTSDEVTLTDGITPKETVVTGVAITSIDPDTDIVTGEAEPGSPIHVSACDVWYCPTREEVTNESGHWTSDFSDPSQPTFDIVPGTWVDAGQTDDDGDNTMFGWGVPNPRIVTRPKGDWIRARDWPLGTMLTLTIDDPSNGTGVDYTIDATAEDWGAGTLETYADFDLNGFDVQPGQILTVAGGGIERALIPTDLAVINADIQADIVSGTTTSNLEVFVNACADYAGYNCAELHVTPDPVTHTWIVNFSGIIDLIPGSYGRAEQSDANGNITRDNWNTPNPHIVARLDDDWVYACNWPLGTILTLTIDDPSDGTGDVDYTIDTTVEGYEWGETHADFDLNGFDVQPSQTLTVTGDGIERTLVPTDLTVTNVDDDADTIFGTTTSDLEVLVMGCAGDTCFEGSATPDASTHTWIVDFSGIVDLVLGTTGGVAEQHDASANSTRVDWKVEGGTISGTVYAVEIAPENTVAGVMIEACTTDLGFCRTAITDASGQYKVEGLPEGTFNLRAMPPGLNLPGRLGPVTIAKKEDLTGQDIILPEPPQSPPPDPIEPAHTGGGTISVYWQDDLTLTAYGCANGTATFELTVLDDGYTINGVMTEMPVGSGTYKATIPPLYPHHDVAEIVYTINCSDGSTTEIPFYIYIDPSGVVKDTFGAPIADATVTLYHSDNPDGPFNEVPDGSTMMSPSNRDNPDTTNTNGQFGWDVLAGFYKVRAEKAGCFSPTDPTQAYVESIVLTVPPPVTNLELILQCSLPPTANAGGPYTVTWGETLNLDGSASTDPDNNIASYEWDLDNDGEYDDASGVTPATSFNQVGDHTIGLRVTDDGGLSDTDTATVTVLPWTLKGFYQPVDMNGVYNLVKGGSTVPLKFEVFAGPTELTDVASVKSLTYAQTTCDANAITDEIETTVTGGTSLRYDATTGQFIYNWKTPKTPGKCYRVTMTTMDSSSLVAYFKLK